MKLLIHLCLFLFSVWSGLTVAHEVRPGYLQIDDGTENTYRIIWKVPAKGDRRLVIDYLLPAHCLDVSPVKFRVADGAFVTERQVACGKPLAGEAVSFSGLSATLTDVVVRYTTGSGSSMLRITGDDPRLLIPIEPGITDIVRTYIELGVEHILFGYDHLLFVFCLLLLSGFNRAIIGIVTAFTVAHSLTLLATSMHIIYLAIAPVEACIALSIVYTASRAIEQKAGSRQHHLWITAFVFGLLHGFGFASALQEIGLPDNAIITALLSFNLGVELGQLTFVAVCYAVFRWGQPRIKRLAEARRYSAYAAGGIAGYWVIQRVLLIVS